MCVMATYPREGSESTLILDKRDTRMETFSLLKLKDYYFAGTSDHELYFDWEYKMNEFFTSYDCPEFEKVFIAAAQLIEQAQHWWSREIIEGKRFSYFRRPTWVEMRNLMRRQYVPRDKYSEICKKFFTLCQDERTVMEYQEKFHYLRIRLNPGVRDETIIYQFEEGLKDHIRRQLQRWTYVSLDELIQHAIQIERHVEKPVAKEKVFISEDSPKPRPIGFIYKMLIREAGQDEILSFKPHKSWPMDDLVLRTKPFKEGGNDAVPKSWFESHRAFNGLTRSDQDICPLHEVYRTNQKDLSSKPNCSGNSTNKGIVANWNGDQRSSDRTGIEFTNRTIPEQFAVDAGSDMCPLFDAFQFKKDDSESETTWRTFPAHLEHISNWKPVNTSSDDGHIMFSSQVKPNLPDSDQLAYSGGFESNQKESSYKPTWYAILIQHRSSENWIHAKTGFGLEDTQFPNRKILDLPYLEPFGIGRFGDQFWRLVEPLIQLEAPKDTSCFSSSLWIRWIQSWPSKHKDLPYLTPRALKSKHQRLYSDFVGIKGVMRRLTNHGIIQKLSRYKDTRVSLLA